MIDRWVACLEQAQLILAGQTLELDAHQAFDERRDAIVGARGQDRQHRQLLALLQELGDELEARAVAPLHAVEHDHERPLLRGAREQEAQAGGD